MTAEASRFDRRLRLEFHGANVTSDAGLLAYLELDDALQLTDSAADVRHDSSTHRNTHQSLGSLLRRSLFGRLGGYDAQRLRVDPAIPTMAGVWTSDHAIASTSEIGRFETEALMTSKNLDLSGHWFEQTYRGRP